MKPHICLVMIIWLLAGLHHAAAQVSFSPPVNYAVSHTANLTVADVNRDRKVDLICPDNTVPGTLTILTNDGSGGFAPASMPSVGNGPVVVTSADVNGDGKVELISANWGNGSGNSLTVLTNNGNGGFGSNATCTVGVGPSFVTAADINGDGKLDLINANIGYFNGNTLTVLTNNANGGFGSSATYAVGNNPTEVIAADVNGDGKLDLISADSGVGVNTLMVLTNKGSGVFGSNATYTVNRPVWIASADINGDGKVDLICANYDANTLTVLTNNGRGRFVLAATLNVDKSPSAVVAADVNGDGKLDLISANGDNTISVLLNTSTFLPPTSAPPVAINIQACGLRVSWPSASAGWSLQQNPDLTTANWGPSGYNGYDISDDGTNRSLTIPSQPGNLYFRPLHP